MRRILYTIVVAALLLVPAEKSDVGDLLPVEVVMTAAGDGEVTIMTDTGNIGTGETLRKAYLDMQEHAQEQIYLDTADYLILEGTAEELAAELGQYLKPGIRVCRSSGEIDITNTAQYLSNHMPKYTLKDLNQKVNIETLRQESYGFALE